MRALAQRSAEAAKDVKTGGGLAPSLGKSKLFPRLALQMVAVGEESGELDDIEHALARMDEGTYGTCEVCGSQITAARLELLPATRFCIDHA